MWGTGALLLLGRGRAVHARSRAAALRAACRCCLNLPSCPRAAACFLLLTPSPTTPTCSATPRLDTDVALGRAGGLLTVLPMTGVTTEAKLAAAAPGELPHYVVPNLAALAGLEF